MFAYVDAAGSIAGVLIILNEACVQNRACRTLQRRRDRDLLERGQRRAQR